MANKPKKKGGRPPIPVKQASLHPRLQPKEIILDQVLYWMSLQATAEEIAASFNVSADTLDKALKDNFGMNFSELFARYAAYGKLSLRRFQHKQAERYPQMGIWLGKVWLGQKDPANDKESQKTHDNGFQSLTDELRQWRIKDEQVDPD